MIKMHVCRDGLVIKGVANTYGVYLAQFLLHLAISAILGLLWAFANGSLSSKAYYTSQWNSVHFQKFLRRPMWLTEGFKQYPLATVFSIPITWQNRQTILVPFDKNNVGKLIDIIRIFKFASYLHSRKMKKQLRKFVSVNINPICFVKSLLCTLIKKTNVFLTNNFFNKSLIHFAMSLMTSQNLLTFAIENHTSFLA